MTELVLPKGRAHDEAAAPVSGLRSRVEWLDVAKGLGILLVVLGHVLRGLVGSNLLSQAGPAGTVDRFLYAFHMPLFFVVAGLFLPRAAARPLGEFGKERLERLAYPYLIWAPLQTLLQIVTSRYTNHPEHLSSLLRIAYVPPMQHWFLYALFLASFVAALLYKAGVRTAGFVVVALLCIASEGVVPLGPWEILYPTRHYLSYLCLGAAAGMDGVRRLGAATSRLHAVVALTGFAVVAGAVARGFTPDGARPFVALAVALSGVSATLSLSVLVVRAWPGVRASLPDPASWLRYLGEQSLVIFVAHTIASAAARIVLQRGFHVVNAPLHVLVGCAAGVVAPLLLERAAARTGVPLFVFPGSRARRRGPAAARPRAPSLAA